MLHALRTWEKQEHAKAEGAHEGESPSFAFCPLLVVNLTAEVDRPALPP